MKAKRFFRAISSVVLVAFVSLTMQPLQAAIQVQRAQAKAATPAPKAADEKYGETLREIEEQSLKAKGNRGKGKSSKAEAKAIRAYVKALDALEGDVEAGFAATEKHLRDKKLAQVILDRHNEAVATYRQKRDEFRALARAVDTADDSASDAQIDSTLTTLGEFFEKHSQIRKRAKLDPNKLPWRTPEVTKRVPITDAKQFKTARFGYEPTLVAGAVPAGTKVSKAVSGKPTPDDLAETEDAQITPAIRAKAVELGNDPLKIYLWVRNNIRFVPTYGSIQGSQDTLDKLAGNAFDTASLLIALLRAANVPARYAYGTIDVPAGQAMNWVGGVTKIEAAQQVLGQGGIPNIPVVSGGVVSHIRMEHVWVEAWVDFMPSRGARNLEGDTWVPVDASFKQYATAPGMNIHAAVSFDTQAFMTGTLQGATSNSTEGWIKDFNNTVARTRIDTHKNAIKAAIDARNPNATIGDVIGTQSVITSSESVLAGTLANRVVARGPTYTALPSSLRHKFRYALFASAFDRSLDSPVWTFEESTARLAGKQLTLRFRPASDADREYFEAVFEAGQANGFAGSIASFARVTAELVADGVVVASGGTFAMGAELAGMGGFTTPDLSDWDLSPDDSLVAGQVSILGLSIQGVSAEQIRILQLRMEDYTSRIAGGTSAGISAPKVTEDALTAMLWGYFLGLQAQTTIVSADANMIDKPGLSYGLMHVSGVPNKLFGVVTTSVSFRGVLLDIGHMRSMRYTKDADPVKWVAYNKSRGLMASAFEHLIPERFLIAPNGCEVGANCSVGYSAVKALRVAQAIGQKTYSIRHANVAQLDSVSLGAGTKAELESAVLAGKEVVVHERAVTIGNWTGSGYVVVDPATGAGAYMIESGANGGGTDGPVEPPSDFAQAMIAAIVAGILGIAADAILPWYVAIYIGLGVIALKNVFQEYLGITDFQTKMTLNVIEMMTVFVALLVLGIIGASQAWIIAALIALVIEVIILIGTGIRGKSLRVSLRERWVIA